MYTVRCYISLLLSHITINYFLVFSVYGSVKISVEGTEIDQLLLFRNKWLK